MRCCVLRKRVGGEGRAISRPIRGLSNPPLLAAGERTRVESCIGSPHRMSERGEEDRGSKVSASVA